MIPKGLEGLIGKPSLGCEGVVEGLGSGRYVGLGRESLSGIYGSGKWPSTWDRGPGNWPLVRIGRGGLRGSSGSEGPHFVVPGARGVGASVFRRLVMGDGVMVLGGWVRWVPVSSGAGDELRVVRVARILVGRS